MTNGRKGLIGALAAVLAFTLTAAFLLFAPIRSVKAERSAAWNVIGEIYNDSTQKFNQDNLSKLYQALTGTGTFASVQTAAEGGDRTSAYFRDQNDGKNVSVWFGGKKWDAVYLTTATNGEVILDLWQSADNTNINTGFGEIMIKELGHTDPEWAAAPDPADTYHANIYSTSKLRVDTLNAGGYYLTDKDVLSGEQGQDSGNQYARFTMPKDKVANSLIEYIAKPSEVGYQSNEFNGAVSRDLSIQAKQTEDLTNGDPYYLPNDAYGTPSGGGKWYSTEYGNLYTQKDSSRDDAAKYGAWQNDYIWLPSVTEIGSSENEIASYGQATGLWDTDLSLRSSCTDPANSVYAWLRSGFCSNAHYWAWLGGSEKDCGCFLVYVMNTKSDHTDWTNDVTESNLVRPALHLNLTKANNDAGSSWNKIDEIYNDGTGFNADNVKELYNALTGTNSYSGVKTALNGGNKTSAEFRSRNEGKNVQVTFGGLVWDVVYLTQANGNVILDLWQSADSVTETSQWAYRTKANDNPSDTYPDNMYSTSYIRVCTLNAGGQYSTSGSELTSSSQSSENKYARFTMPKDRVANSLIEYIAKPSEVGYQADEFDSATANEFSGGYYAPNDAYGTPSGGSWMWNKETTYSYDYSKKGEADKGTDYSAWKNDYVWLPSITETGCSENGTGLWKTDIVLRSTVTINGQNFAWTRTGDDNWAANAYSLDITGVNDYKNSTVDTVHLVRPAIHLNLTAINNTLKTEVEVPTIVNKTYTGEKLTPDLSLDKYQSNFEGDTEVGTYSVTLTLNDPDNFKWEGKDPNASSVDLSFEITPATNAWKDGGLKLSDWTYGDINPPEPSAPSTFGTATFTYYNDKNGEADTSPLGARPTAAGTYWVKATVPAGKSTKEPLKNNYEELESAPVQFKIEQATLTVKSATVANKTYNGKDDDAKISFTFDGYKYSDDDPTAINVAGYTAKYESADAATSVTVTVSEITLGGTAAGNYTVDLSKPYTTTGKIEKATATVTITPPQNAVYTGTEHPATVSISVDGGIPELTAGDYTISYQGEVSENKTPINVDEYTVTVLLTSSKAKNYKLSSATATYTITIADNEWTVQPDIRGWIYGETPNSPTGGETKFKDTSVEFTYSEEENGTYSDVKPTEAGTYWLKAEVAGTSNYNTLIKKVNFTIGQAALSFELVKSKGTYSGVEHGDIDVVFKNSKEELTSEDYKLEFKAVTGKLGEKNLPLFAGTYTVKLTLLSDAAQDYELNANTATYEIEKATITVSGSFADEKIYNGENYQITASAEVGRAHGLTIEMTADDPTFEIYLETEKFAEIYEGEIENVTFDGVNFELKNDATFTIEISKAELRLSLFAESKIYDGNDVAAVTGEISEGKVSGDEVSVGKIIARFESAAAGENKQILIDSIAIIGSAADNYEVIFANLPQAFADIERATASVAWSGFEGLIYDGELKEISAAATGVDGEKIELEITYISNVAGVELVGGKPINAGEYTATASTANGNYALSENTKTYAVAKQQVTAPTIASKVYNRAAQTADVETSALYSIVNEGGTNAGNYNVKLTLNDSTNYKWTTSDDAEITLIFTITKAEYDMSGVTFEDFSIIYDGEEHGIFIGGELPFEEVTVRYENNGQIKVGEYTVTAIFEGDADNYELIPEKTATLTILAVSHDLSGIAFDDVTVKYDGQAHEIFIEGTLPTNVRVEYSGNGQVKPNIYTISALFYDPDGKFDEMTATLTILRTQTQAQTQSQPDEPGGAGGGGSQGTSSTPSEPSADEEKADVFIDSEEGFDPTLELVVEKVEDTERSYLAWGADEVSERYSVKLCKDGVEVPIDGTVTVRLLIPEGFREKNFELQTVARAISVQFTREGDYVVFEADGLSDYVFTSAYAPYFPVIIAATGALFADLLIMIVLTVTVVKKMKNGKAR